MIFNILLSQGAGAIAKPIVSKGEYVKRGQLIAIPNGLGANIHSSASGVVADVNEISIIIEASDIDKDDFIKLEKSDSLIEMIEDAGIVGAGGAGFPTYIKLKSELVDGILIANASECEPNLHHNIELMTKYPDLIIRGISLAMQALNVKKAIIAIKEKHTEAVKALNNAIGSENISIKYVQDLYPSGDERVLVRELLNVELKPGELPLKAGAVVLNVETLKNIAMCIDERKPVIDKDLTVGGRVIDSPRGKVYLDVPIGTSFKDMIDKSKCVIDPFGEIVAGGAFTGKKADFSYPVTKVTGGISVSMPFPTEKRKLGLLGCECGASIERLKEIAEGMNADVVASINCKRMEDIGNNRLRCNLPGVCPGQAESVLNLKKQGAQALLVGSCQH
ncbi:MAG: proline reductase-associated electron transfer protein PrdC [Tissierellales bacterium]|nr:proline reductase-associated electron transfer protein PrdC [Tissierellales bacterium]